MTQEPPDLVGGHPENRPALVQALIGDVMADRDVIGGLLQSMEYLVEGVDRVAACTTRPVRPFQTSKLDHYRLRLSRDRLDIDRTWKIRQLLRLQHAGDVRFFR